MWEDRIKHYVIKGSWTIHNKTTTKKYQNFFIDNGRDNIVAHVSNVAEKSSKVIASDTLQF